MENNETPSEGSYEYESSSGADEAVVIQQPVVVAGDQLIHQNVVEATQEMIEDSPVEVVDTENQDAPDLTEHQETEDNQTETDHEPQFASEGEATELGDDISDDESQPVEEPEELTFPFNYTKYFTDHPSKANQGYLEHFIDTLKYSIVSGMCSVMFLVHGIFPFLFEFIGSDHLLSLALEIEGKRKKIQENMLKRLKQQKEKASIENDDKPKSD